MNWLLWNAYNSAVYKITSTYTWELEAWQGGATSAMPFISSNQGKRGASFCPSKLALQVQYKYNTNTKKSDVNF